MNPAGRGSRGAGPRAGEQDDAHRRDCSGSWRGGWGCARSRGGRNRWHSHGRDSSGLGLGHHRSTGASGAAGALHADGGGSSWSTLCSALAEALRAQGRALRQQRGLRLGPQARTWRSGGLSRGREWRGAARGRKAKRAGADVGREPRVFSFLSSRLCRRALLTACSAARRGRTPGQRQGVRQSSHARACWRRFAIAGGREASYSCAGPARPAPFCQPPAPRNTHGRRSRAHS